MIKRLTSVIIVCTLLSAFLVIPAHAAELSGDATVSGVVGNSLSALQSASSSFEFSTIPYSTTVGDSFDSSVFLGNGPNYFFSVNHLSVPLRDVQKNVIVAYSYYLTVVNDDPSFYSSGDLTPVATWVDVNGVSRSGSATWNSFVPAGPDPNLVSKGITVSATFKASEVDTISNPSIAWDPSICYVKATKGAPKIRMFVPSFRVIQTDASGADLEQLQDIAGGIAKSNQILEAMYGDILAICNSIYERTGSILEAQNLSNQYFASIVPYVKSIDTRINRIYKLLGQQFSLLISTIQTESDDIQATINAAIDKMIAYLDNAFNSSINPALPGTSQDITTNNGTVHNAESDYQSTATERFDSISANFSGFDGSILSGVALGGTLFQRLWNVLGDYVILYTFPLTLSICLVVVGRLSRSASRSGGSKKKDGDDS